MPFTESGLEYLFKKISEQGFKGTIKDLENYSATSVSLSELETFHRFMDFLKNQVQVNKLALVDDIRMLADKLFYKYESNINVDFCGRTSLHFYSRVKTDRYDKYQVSFYFEDRTGCYSNGVSGTSNVRILYGFGDHRKEQVITFIESKQLSE